MRNTHILIEHSLENAAALGAVGCISELSRRLDLKLLGSKCSPAGGKKIKIKKTERDWLEPSISITIFCSADGSGLSELFPLAQPLLLLAHAYA